MVFQFINALLAGAVGTAIESIRRLHAMTDNTAATVRTGGSQHVDGALKTVEDMRFAAQPHLKAFVVDIATYFTRRCLITQHTFTFIHIFLFL
jgi:hypothetical protein